MAVMNAASLVKQVIAHLALELIEDLNEPVLGANQRWSGHRAVCAGVPGRAPGRNAPVVAVAGSATWPPAPGLRAAPDGAIPRRLRSARTARRATPKARRVPEGPKRHRFGERACFRFGRERDRLPHRHVGHVERQSTGIVGSIGFLRFAAVRQIDGSALVQPADPQNGASPKAKTPPSPATIQYPWPSSVVAIPVIEALSTVLPSDPLNAASKAKMPPSLATSQ
jgi:hypothetical protein